MKSCQKTRKFCIFNDFFLLSAFNFQQSSVLINKESENKNNSKQSLVELIPVGNPIKEIYPLKKDNLVLNSLPARYLC